MPRMTNTFMLGGKDDPAELIERVPNGIYAKSFGGGQVDITNGKFVFSCTEAYKIEDGRIGPAVKGATLIGNGPDALTRVKMIGSDLQLDPGIGTCGKDGQGVPVGVGQPSLLLEALTVGGTAEKRSEIARIDSKKGRSGTLVFVTLRHTISQGSVIAMEEEQDLVYRAPPAPGDPAPAGKPAPRAQWSEPVHPDAPLLFRYSALTFNGHRIHYDAPYATEVEGYPALVVHGPLTATLLQGLAAKARPGGRLTSFAFRGLAPLFVDRTFHIEAAESEEGLSLWARNERGEMAMQASATFG